MPSRRVSVIQKSASSSRSSKTTVITSSTSRVTTLVSSSRTSPITKREITPVKSRLSSGSPLTPGWVSGRLAVFESPKSASPSPKRPRTRRSSVYTKKTVVSRIPQRSSKAVKGSNVFKMPTVFSPPGVKTRSRRSSIFAGPAKKSPLQSASLSVREMVEIVRSTSMEEETESPTPKRRILKARRASSSKKKTSTATKSVSSKTSSDSKKDVSISSSRSSHSKKSSRKSQSPSKSPSRSKKRQSKSPAPKAKRTPKRTSSNSRKQSTRSTKKRSRDKQEAEDDKEISFQIKTPSHAQKRRRVVVGSSKSISSKSNSKSRQSESPQKRVSGSPSPLKTSLASKRLLVQINGFAESPVSGRKTNVKKSTPSNPSTPRRLEVSLDDMSTSQLLAVSTARSSSKKAGSSKKATSLSASKKSPKSVSKSKSKKKSSTRSSSTKSSKRTSRKSEDFESDFNGSDISVTSLASTENETPVTPPRKSLVKSRGRSHSPRRTRKSSSKRNASSKKSSRSSCQSTVKTPSTPKSSSKHISSSKKSSKSSSKSTPVKFQKTPSTPKSSSKKKSSSKRSVKSSSRLTNVNSSKARKSLEVTSSSFLSKEIKTDTSPGPITPNSVNRKSLSRSALSSAKRSSTSSRRQSLSAVKSGQKRRSVASLTPLGSFTSQSRSKVSPRNLLQNTSGSSLEATFSKRRSVGTPQSFTSLKSESGSARKSVESVMSTYRSTEGFSPVISVKKRKTALTPFYESLTAKRRRTNDSTDMVDSPLVSSTPLGRLSIKSSLGSSFGSAVRSSRQNISRTSYMSSSTRGGYGNENSLDGSYISTRYSYSRNGEDDEEGKDYEDDEMIGEEYSTRYISSSGDMEVATTKSKSWCSVM